MQIQKRQNLAHLRRLPHVRRKDHAFEPPPLAFGVHPLVVDPRSPHRHRPGPKEDDLALVGVAVANHEGMAPLLALFFFGRLDVRLDLGLQSFGEHPPRPLPCDLVEVEDELFAVSVCPSDVCSPSVYPFPRRSNVGSSD